MIDLHCHVLPQIDDGSKSIKESIEILREAEQAGFTEVFATPHHLEGSIEESVDKKQFLLNELQRQITEQDIKVKLYPRNRSLYKSRYRQIN